MILVPAQVPLVLVGSLNFGVGPREFGLLRVRVWGQGLTILNRNQNVPFFHLFENLMRKIFIAFLPFPLSKLNIKVKGVGNE